MDKKFIFILFHPLKTNKCHNLYSVLLPLFAIKPQRREQTQMEMLIQRWERHLELLNIIQIDCRSTNILIPLHYEYSTL